MTRNNLISNLRGKILGYDEFTVGGGTLSVDDSLGDALTGEVGEFVEEVEVLEKNGAVWSDSQRVLVVVEGGSGGSCDNLLVSSIDHLKREIINSSSIQTRCLSVRLMILW